MRTALVTLVVLAAFLVIGFLIYSLTLTRGGAHARPGLDRGQFLPAAIPGHVEALKSGGADARRGAAHALWMIGEDAREATPALVAVAKDADPAVRAEVILALGRTSRGTQDALPALVEALKSDNAAVRAAGAKALAEIWNDERGERGRPLEPASAAAAKPAIPLLVDALSSKDAEVRVNAANALAMAGVLAEPGIDALIAVVGKDANDKARLHAAIALGNVGPASKGAVPVLLERLHNDKIDGIRGNIAVSLGKIRHNPRAVVPALVKTFLEEEFGDVKGSAVLGISYFGADAALAAPLLRAAAEDPKYKDNEEMLRSIHQVLRQLERYAPGGKGG